MNADIKKLIEIINSKLDEKIGGETNVDLIEEECEKFFQKTGIRIDPETIYNEMA